MGENTKKREEGKVEKKEEVKKEIPYNAVTDLRRNLFLLDKCVRENTREKLSRVLRNTTRIRQLITKDQLEQAIKMHLSPDLETKSTIADFASHLPAEKNDDIMAVESSESKEKEAPFDLPEVEVYLHLLVLSRLHMSQLNDVALQCAKALIDRSTQLNRRTLDVFTAKAYGYYSLFHQSNGNLVAIRSELMAAYRTACLRHDEIGQATLLNLLLGSYLSENLYDLAFKLVSKTTFPESASNNQFIRYLYYVGKIQAIQLDYTDAHTKLMQASRKAPQNTGAGFRRAVTKLSIIVQLLMGEIPERVIFHQEGFKTALMPYMELTNAVRVGNLVEFNSVMDKYADLFKKDKTYTLILRLRHNVIKTGLRKINISYSRISFANICEKLALETPQNAEFVCAKAIYDGVIDAVIDHTNGWMQSKEMIDVYSTDEPQQAFHKRTTFCLDVHNEAVKAMRYPPDAYKDELESAEERLEREKQDEELQKELEEEMDEEGL